MKRIFLLLILLMGMSAMVNAQSRKFPDPDLDSTLTYVKKYIKNFKVNYVDGYQSGQYYIRYEDQTSDTEITYDFKNDAICSMEVIYQHSKKSDFDDFVEKIKKDGYEYDGKYTFKSEKKKKQVELHLDGDLLIYRIYKLVL